MYIIIIIIICLSVCPGIIVKEEEREMLNRTFQSLRGGGSKSGVNNVVLEARWHVTNINNNCQLIRASMCVYVYVYVCMCVYVCVCMCVYIMYVCPDCH